MNPLRSVAQVFLLLNFCLVVMSQGLAQTNAPSEASWKSLTNEASRGQLFQRYSKEMATSLQTAAQPFAFPSAFHFSHDALQDTHGVDRKDSIFGIDISHYEGNNFPLCGLARQKVRFVYIKATQGTNYADKTFDHNWRTIGGQCGDQKIPRGAYHFLSSDPKMSGKDQADRFVDYVSLHGGFAMGDLSPAVDLEWDIACKNCPDQWQTYHRSPDQIVSTTTEFLMELKARTNGRTPMIYTNKNFLKDERITDPGLIAKLTGGYKVWIFDLDSHDRAIELPNPANNLSHLLWQFSFTATVPGYAGSFDANVFKGKPETLEADFQAALTGND